MDLVVSQNCKIIFPRCVPYFAPVNERESSLAFITDHELYISVTSPSNMANKWRLPWILQTQVRWTMRPKFAMIMWAERVFDLEITCRPAGHFQQISACSS